MFTFFDFQIVKELIFKVFKKSFYGSNLKSARTLSILKEGVGFLEKRLTLFFENSSFRPVSTVKCVSKA